MPRSDAKRIRLNYFTSSEYSLPLTLNISHKLWIPWREACQLRSSSTTPFHTEVDTYACWKSKKSIEMVT